MLIKVRLKVDNVMLDQALTLIYLESEQNAEVPRWPVIEGVNQINTFDHFLLQGLWSLSVHCQLVIAVFGLKHSKGKGKIH